MRIVVQAWENVLIYRDGIHQETLGPGRHRRSRRHTVPVWVPVRPRLMAMPVQEVLTGDGLSVKLSLVLTVRTADPRLWHEAVDGLAAFVYSAVQIALREEVAALTLDALLADRAGLPERVRLAVQDQAAAVGAALDAVALRDVIVPAELRRAAAALASARAEGLAALERARSEVAATRAMANAARLMADHPALLALRTLQAVEAGGATVVLSADPALATGHATS
ncbi:SPFH domain-containing protein [Cellulomonas denverensis]|uniref:SPFH domain-containing protein n=1 Tax=Cellulomonas denverensis TaxID=264297 RepID=UPI0035E9AFC6